MSTHPNLDRLLLGGADLLSEVDQVSKYLAVLRLRRAEVEARIEELIALLDLLDGDENLEPYLADTDPENVDREDDDEREPEETDQNGDEEDFCRSEDEWRPYSGNLQFDGSGVALAKRMMRGMH